MVFLPSVLEIDIAVSESSSIEEDICASAWLDICFCGIK